MMSEQSVFVVGDEASACEIVGGLANSMGINAETFQSAEGFLQRCSRSHAGCLVLDLALHGMSEMALLDVMRRRGIYLPTIVVTGHADIDLAVRVMQAGVFTLLEKPFRIQELLETILQALALDAKTRPDGHPVAVRTKVASLTPNERLVLDLIIMGRTNKSISVSLSVPLRTIESRRQCLMAKLDANSLAALIRIVTEARLLTADPVRTQFSAPPPRSNRNDSGLRDATPVT
jgi:FixJ family two-component response regulator